MRIIHYIILYSFAYPFIEITDDMTNYLSAYDFIYDT